MPIIAIPASAGTRAQGWPNDRDAVRTAARRRSEPTTARNTGGPSATYGHGEALVLCRDRQAASTSLVGGPCLPEDVERRPAQLPRFFFMLFQLFTRQRSSCAVEIDRRAALAPARRQNSRRSAGPQTLRPRAQYDSVSSL